MPHLVSVTVDADLLQYLVYVVYKFLILFPTNITW